MLGRRFEAFVTEIAQDTSASLSLPPGLKRLSRILEKVLTERTPTSASVSKVKDIVRGMLTADSMDVVTRLALAFLSDERIVVCRIKDRFVEKPSPGGWRDLMINFFLRDDPHRHVCEVQIVHSRMLVARQGLPGHAIYDKVRNAIEILEKLGVSDKERRHERVREIRTEPLLQGKYDIGNLLRIGFTVEDLIKGGFEELDWVKAGLKSNRPS